MFRDRWKLLRTGSSARLGYSEGRYLEKPLRPLLEKASGAWTDRTAGMSMRETENEINLLVPGDLSTPVFEAPDWTFGAQASDPDPEPEGDEMGDSMLRKAAQR